MFSQRAECWFGGSIRTHLVRESQGQLDLVIDGLSISAALNRSAEEGRTSPQGRAGEAEGVHFAMV